jgi:hypothetical protein
MVIIMALSVSMVRHVEENPSWQSSAAIIATAQRATAVCMVSVFRRTSGSPAEAGHHVLQEAIYYTEGKRL